MKDKNNRKGRGGAPFGNRNAAKHGLSTLKQALKEAGLAAIDKRTALGRELALRRQAIEQDAGGRESLSQLQCDLIDRYLRTCVLIESIDAYLFQQRGLVKKKKKQVYPVVRDRAQLVDSALRLAQTIGLERRPAPIPSIEDYMRQKAARNQESGRKDDSHN